jgi:hypothetical protein
MVVLGLAAVAMLFAFGTSITSSAEHSQLTSFDTVLRTATEQATNYLETVPASQVCAANSTLNQNLTLPSGYTYGLTNWSYWGNSAVGQSSSCGQTASGQTFSVIAEQFTLTVTSSGKSSSLATLVPIPQTPPTVSPSGAPAQLVFIQNPGSGFSGFPLYPQPVLEIENSSGQPIGSDLAPITLSVTSTTGGSGKLSGCSASPIDNAIYFTGCTISAPGTYTLTATDSTDNLTATTQVNVIGSGGS